MAAYKPEFDVEKMYQRYCGLCNMHTNEMSEQEKHDHKQSFMLGCHAMLELLLNDLHRFGKDRTQEIVVDVRKQVRGFFYLKNRGN